MIQLTLDRNWIIAAQEQGERDPWRLASKNVRYWEGKGTSCSSTGNERGRAEEATRPVSLWVKSLDQLTTDCWKEIQIRYEVDKQKNHEMLESFKEKTFKATRDLEKLTDDHTRLLNDMNELKDKFTTLQAERDQLQTGMSPSVQKWSLVGQCWPESSIWIVW